MNIKGILPPLFSTPVAGSVARTPESRLLPPSGRDSYHLASPGIPHISSPFAQPAGVRAVSLRKTGMMLEEQGGGQQRASSDERKGRRTGRVIATAALFSGSGRKHGSGLIVAGSDCDIDLYRAFLRTHPRYAVIFSSLLYPSAGGFQEKHALQESDFSSAAAVMEIQHRPEDETVRALRGWIAAQGFLFGIRQDTPRLILMEMQPEEVGLHLFAFHTPIRVIANADTRQLCIAQIRYPSSTPPETTAE